MNALTNEKLEESVLASRGRALSFFETPQQDNETQRVLRRALELLGPNGENWIQNRFYGKRGFLWKHDTYCSVTALRQVDGGSGVEGWMDSVVYQKIVPGEIVMSVNDRAKSFAEVRAMFEKAIALATSQP